MSDSTLARIETAADELMRLRGQQAHINERLRNLAAILHLGIAVAGPSPDRATLVVHGLTGAARIAEALICETN